MKRLIAIALVAFGLTACSLLQKSKNDNANSNTASTASENTNTSTNANTSTPTASKEETVKNRIKELFAFCKADNKSAAAAYIMYRGPDQNRSGKDIARYDLSIDDKHNVDSVCANIRGYLDNSEGYDFGKFRTQEKGSGPEVVGWEVIFSTKQQKAGAIYAFTLLNGKYVLVDIDSISDSGVKQLEVPPVRKGVTTIVGAESPNAVAPIAPGSGAKRVEANPPPAAKPTPHAPISGGVLNGKAISLPKPAYPAIAKAAHASGTVVVQVLIDEAGKVISAHAVSGHPLLQQAAVAAARQARFSPTLLSGVPVKVTGVVQYHFVAQ